METIDRNTLYSILDKDPKRARAYWFLSVHVLDEPNAMNYQVETLARTIFPRKAQPRFQERPAREHLPAPDRGATCSRAGSCHRQERKYSIYGPSQVGSFKFLMLRAARCR